MTSKSRRCKWWDRIDGVKERCAKQAEIGSKFCHIHRRMARQARVDAAASALRRIKNRRSNER